MYDEEKVLCWALGCLFVAFLLIGVIWCALATFAAYDSGPYMKTMSTALGPSHQVWIDRRYGEDQRMFVSPDPVEAEAFYWRMVKHYTHD